MEKFVRNSFCFDMSKKCARKPGSPRETKRVADYVSRCRLQVLFYFEGGSKRKTLDSSRKRERCRMRAGEASAMLCNQQRATGGLKAGSRSVCSSEEAMGAITKSRQDRREGLELSAKCQGACTVKAMNEQRSQGRVKCEGGKGMYRWREQIMCKAKNQFEFGTLCLCWGLARL
jgi:hypothetical protein